MILGRLGPVREGRHQHLRHRRRLEHLPDDRAHVRPEPPGRDARHPDPRRVPDLPAARARAPAALAARRSARVPRARRALDALAQRPARDLRRPLRARDPVPAPVPEAALPRAARRARPRRRRSSSRAARASSRTSSTARTSTSGSSVETHLAFYSLIRPGARAAPVLRPRAEHVLGLLRVPHREDELRAALVLRRAAHRDGARRRGALHGLGRLPLPLPREPAPDRPRAWPRRATGRRRACGRSSWGLTAALAGTLASNIFYLTMQMYYFTVFAALVVAAPVVFSRAARREE